jgi:hypothetical protein
LIMKKSRRYYTNNKKLKEQWPRRQRLMAVALFYCIEAAHFPNIVEICPKSR